MSGANIRVVLADDENLLLDSLSLLLSLEDDLEVVAQACTGAESIEAVREHQPDVAILDLDMPVLDGLSATAEILREVPLVKIVLLTRHARPAALRRALASGAAAFVTKTTSSEELPRIIRTVNQGGRYVDSRIASAALTEGDCPLTARELEALREALDGATVNVIAERVHLAPGTVRNYLSSAMTKLHAVTRVEAAKKAWDEGWI
ncbi:response regulator transcription factor [Saccharopolyspora gloriosae]|uniref:Two-component system response regulator DesR n=1 Tax=Saccharopolyspora gloriosae TaxID=455344 RepID=A0A840NK66_9PSEU|nr:response regulator transcription factor [Saccharopolyspora gloriosae]MBB5071461.1 two-component system response regulator DesR [Saccharopolyspora gloriosae]